MIWIFDLLFYILFWMFVWDGTGWRDFDGLTAGCMCMQNNKTGVSGNAGRSLESEDLVHESILILLFSAFFCFDLCYLYSEPWCTLYASPNWPSLSAGLLSACILHPITSNLFVSAGLQQLDYRHASAQLDAPMIIPGILKLPPDWSRIFARIEPESEIFCTHAYSSALLWFYFCFRFFVFFLAFILIHLFSIHSFIDACLSLW